MFDVLDHCQVNELHVRDDADSGLKAIIAIHNTQLGPALGGCRFIQYDSADTALEDAARLARGMSYKAALAGVPQGGGKAVIMKPAGHFDPVALFSEFGRFVQSLQGRYITAIDSGTSATEMDIIAKHTSYVTSTSTAGNPSPYTARGVFEGIRAAVKHKLGSNDLNGVRVALQGVGNVGFVLGKLLDRAGAEVFVSDVNRVAIDEAMKSFASGVIAPDKIASADCDVFAPCGLSKPINDDNIDHLRCRIVAGSANVQLAHHELGQTLHERGILYAPDYVINAGGLIYASLNYHGHDAGEIHDKVQGIYQTLDQIFGESEQDNMPPSEIADRLAQQRLQKPLEHAA
ncbi:MAG: amino acid dehydrogenase [Oleiphilaceae bacterium]|nr:amino acid dehydrogenase [Oleiphilaceae bacterium]